MKNVLIFLAVLIVLGFVARLAFVLIYGKEIIQAEKEAIERKKAERDALFNSVKHI
jgi:hypothetical protein